MKPASSRPARTVHVVLSWLAIVIGFIHAGGTFVFYADFDAQALWFFGAGLFVISAGVLNIAVARSEGRDPFVRYATVLLNVAGCVVGALSIPRVGGPPSYALTVIFLVAAVLILVAHPQEPEGQASES